MRLPPWAQNLGQSLQELTARLLPPDGAAGQPARRPKAEPMPSSSTPLRVTRKVITSTSRCCCWSSRRRR